jgi:hypothetical protein
MSVQKHKLPANTFLKCSVFYYQRRVPTDLRKHYKTSKVTLSLKTKDARSAGKAARKLSHDLEQHWLDLRLKDYDKIPVANSLYAVSNQLLMSEAKQQYLDVKGIGRTEKFESTCNRCIGYLFDVVSDKPLDEYKASDAIAFRDSLARRGLLPVTIKKVFATVKVVHNFATKENGLECLRRHNECMCCSYASHFNDNINYRARLDANDVIWWCIMVSDVGCDYFRLRCFKHTNIGFCAGAICNIFQY